MVRFTVEMRRALEAVPAGIVAINAIGRIIFVNRNFEALSGYSPSELVGRPIEVLIPPGRRQVHRLQRSAYSRTGTPPRPMGVDLDIRCLRKDGSDFRAHVALSPVDTETGRVVIAAVRDRAKCSTTAMAVDRTHLEYDLYDRVLQTLFGVGLHLQSTTAQLTDSAIAQRLEDANRQIADLVRELRNYAYGLRPGILEEAAGSSVEDGEDVGEGA